MIQSKTNPNYFKIQEIFGIHKVRTSMEWGKRFMIEFLEKLGRDWGRDPYWQYDSSDNWADIPLGDISRDGGGPPRSQVPRFNGHGSHRCGRDVDIYYISADGIPRESVLFGSKNFDLERTKLLGKSILLAGRNDLELIFVGGDKLVKAMQDEAKKLGLKHVISNDPSGMHHNHFHVRMINKDSDKMCF